MKLSAVMNGIPFSGNLHDCEITRIVGDSRRIVPGCVFVAMKGRNFDGHVAARDALENGAAAVVTERPLGLDNELVVWDTHDAFCTMCRNFFGNPQDSIRIIGVTGTNGKTTVACLIQQALEKLGEKVGLIGTIKCQIGDLEIPAKFTTPEPWDLYALMSRMKASGCSYLVMEASSQALVQGRLLGLQFDVAIFTNFTQDHLDYHHTMKEYFDAKRILFRQCDRAILNLDNEWVSSLINELGCPVTTFSCSRNDADFTAKNIMLSACNVRFDLNGTGFLTRVNLPMPGEYSAQNAMAVACALFALGFDKKKVCNAISSCKGVRGRSEVLYSEDKTVICDYAHTPDALEQLLKGLKPFVKGRLLLLFGCAGDRDPIKRVPMAEIACKYADCIFLTSDNPRTEDPMLIISQVAPVIEKLGVPLFPEPDRYFAIMNALRFLEKDDVLVLSGKGHEDYQVIDGCTIYLDEHRIVSDFFREYARKGAENGTD